MDFVDQVNLKTTPRWRILHVVEQFTHILDPGTRSRIDLDQIDAAPLVDFTAGCAFTARLGTDALFAIQRLCKYSCDSGLAHTASTAEKVSMMQTIAVERVGQCLQNMLLADHLFEI